MERPSIKASLWPRNTYQSHNRNNRPHVLTRDRSIPSSSLLPHKDGTSTYLLLTTPSHVQSRFGKCLPKHSRCVNKPIHSLLKLYNKFTINIKSLKYFGRWFTIHLSGSFGLISLKKSRLYISLAQLPAISCTDRVQDLPCLQ